MSSRRKCQYYVLLASLVSILSISAIREMFPDQLKSPEFAFNLSSHTVVFYFTASGFLFPLGVGVATGIMLVALIELATGVRLKTSGVAGVAIVVGFVAGVIRFITGFITGLILGVGFVGFGVGAVVGKTLLALIRLAGVASKAKKNFILSILSNYFIKWIPEECQSELAVIYQQLLDEGHSVWQANLQVLRQFPNLWFGICVRKRWDDFWLSFRIKR